MALLSTLEGIDTKKLGTSLSAILLLIAAISSRVIAAGNGDVSECQRLREAFSDSGSADATLVAFSGLAQSEVAVVSKPMDQADFHLSPPRADQLVSVPVACRLKGRPSPGGRRLMVRLLPTGAECAGRPELEATVGGGGGQFVFLLRRSGRRGEWDLLDGGLYTVGDFNRRLGSVCNASQIYGGSCHDDGAMAAEKGYCTSFDLMLDIMETGETQPYNDRPRPHGRQAMYDWRRSEAAKSRRNSATKAGATPRLAAAAATAAAAMLIGAVWLG